MSWAVTILALFIHMQRPRKYGCSMLSGNYQRRDKRRWTGFLCPLHSPPPTPTAAPPHRSR